MPGAVRHIIIQKGDTAPIIRQFWHGGYFSCAVTASTAPKTVHISPTGVALGIGDRLYYGSCSSLVVAAVATATATEVQVSSVPLAIAAGTRFRIKPIDVTGWTGFSSIRTAIDAASSWNFLVTISGNPLNGTFTLDPTPFTNTITANATWKNTTGLPGFNIDDIKTWGKLAKTHYYWDFDLVDTSNIRRRRIQGAALVTGEVTI
jgi:hypothetical protein